MDRRWTVFRTADSRIAQRGLSLVGAADAMLSGYGAIWEVRPVDGGGFRLWISPSRDSGYWLAMRYFSADANRANAEDDIFRELLSDELNGYEAMTDDAYRAMIAEIDR